MEDQYSLNNSPATNSDNAPTAAVDDAGRMEAVRELLFGRQVEEINRDLGSVETRLAENLVAAKRFLGEQIAALETYTRDELGSVHEALGSEESTRNQNELEARSRMETIENEVAAKARRFTDDITALEKSMHERFLEQTKLFGNKLEKAMEEMHEDHKREIESLQNSKTDRSALGDLMIDLGMRLQGNDLAKENQSGRTGATATDETLSN